jgi:radical SAM protein with 4Fe4S-binding SPASM domain
MGTITYRFEKFGGIISSNHPPVLAYVDREYMKKAGFGTSSLWDAAGEADMDDLSAPVEAHVSLTNQCPVGCRHCYNDSKKEPDPETEPPVESILQTIAVLKQMKVFHIALAGGETLLRKDFFEIFEFLKSSGYMPNLTLSGMVFNEELAEKLNGSGQVNVSLDGVGDCFSVFRMPELFRHADRALDLLKKHRINTGINCLLSRGNVDGLEALFDYARKKKVNEIAFLRLKPRGRSRENYLQNRLTGRQAREVPRMIHALSKKYKLAAKFDCSLVPFICRSEPSPDGLNGRLVRGCEAGNYLISISPQGNVSGCGFLDSDGLHIRDLPHEWHRNKNLRDIRNGFLSLKEPCTSCKYLSVCRGGCKAVSEYCTGSLYHPDPECPFVVDYKETLKKGADHE